MVKFSAFIGAFFLLIPHAFTEQKKRETISNLCINGDWETVQKKIEQSKNPITAIGPEAMPICINRSLCDGKNALFSYLITLIDNGAKHVTRACIKEAINRGNKLTLEYALQHGLDISKTYQQENLLHLAAKANKNSVQLTELFLTKNLNQIANTSEAIFDLEQRSLISGATALGEALKHQSYEAAGILLAAGASLLEAIYVAPRPHHEESVLRPNDGQVKIVTAWLEKHGYKKIRDVINDKSHTALYKTGVIRFLSHGLPPKKQVTLAKIWKEYEEKILDELLDQDDSSDETATLSSEEDAEHLHKRNVCLGLCDEAKDHVRLANCEHRICKACAHQTIAHKIAHPEELMVCPATGCNKPIVYETLSDLGIKPYTILKLRVKHKERELTEDPDFHHCQQPDCIGGNFTTFTYDKEKRAHFKCRLCGVTQCKRCGQHHPKVDCQDIRLKQNEQFIKRQIDKKTIKKCPKCDVNIEKNDGCDHMTCNKCKYEFCWSTLKKYQKKS
jgi:hypothetical protein